MTILAILNTMQWFCEIQKNRAKFSELKIFLVKESKLLVDPDRSRRAGVQDDLVDFEVGHILQS